LLVACSDHDVVVAPVASVDEVMDLANATVVPRVRLERAASRGIYYLTEANIGRHIVLMVEGEVVTIAPIETPFSGERLPILNPRLLRDDGATGPYVSVEGIRESDSWRNRIRLTIWDLLGLLLAVVVIALASLPAKGLPSAKYTRAWIIGGAILMAVVLGYVGGVSKEVETSEEPYTPIVVSTNVALVPMALWALVGAVIGAPLGWVVMHLLRRAAFNVRRLIRPFPNR